MAAMSTSDEEMESLLLNFDQIYQGYKDALMELKSLKVECSSERMKREALETAFNDLKSENEHLKRKYTKTLFKFTNQVKYHTEYHNLREELENANSKFLALEEEHKRNIEKLQKKNEAKLLDFENQLRSSFGQRESSENVIRQLNLELASHETHIGILNTKLENVTADVDAHYQNEMQELRSLVMIEREEKNEMQIKIQNAENEMKMMKSKQEEQQRDAMSIHHVESLKQKIMKLRKENESLKRKLIVSEFDNAS